MRHTCWLTPDSGSFFAANGNEAGISSSPLGLVAVRKECAQTRKDAALGPRESL